MFYSYDAIKNKYRNQYQINKAIAEGKIFKIEDGIYSDTKYVSELEVISFKYPNAVFTMDSAFYYLGLTDIIPNKYHLATDKDAAKIKNDKVKQYFIRQERFDIGTTKIKFQNSTIKIYDLERMIIELIRNKSKLPFDYYKEIIESYRNKIYQIDNQKLLDYIEHFPKSNSIMQAIQLEVY